MQHSELTRESMAIQPHCVEAQYEYSRDPRSQRIEEMGRRTRSGLSSYADNIATGAGDAPRAIKTGIAKSWSSKGAWTIGFACFVCGAPIVAGFVWNALMGGISGAVSNKPLPANAPGEMRFSHGATGLGRAVLTGFATGIDQGVRVQLVGGNGQQPVATPARIQPTNRLAPYSGAVIPVINLGENQR